MAIELRGVGYRYAGAPRAALAGIDLMLAPGEVLGLTGANDAGKSTLCLVAAGLAPAVIGGHLEGSVAIDGAPTSALKPFELAQRCGILFQNSITQLSGTSRSVWEEVAFGPRNLGLELADVVGRVERALAALSIGDLVERDPQRLSGGQAQLVALASVLALQPRYLVLDEPTSQLDPQGTRLVGEALRALVDDGTAILLVEHKTDLLARLATSVAVIDAGRIVRAGPTDDVLADPTIADLGVQPPPAILLQRAADAAGVTLDPAALALAR
jgi:energy-coupling factor transport system ATP-binding protein